MFTTHLYHLLTKVSHLCLYRDLKMENILLDEKKKNIKLVGELKPN